MTMTRIGRARADRPPPATDRPPLARRLADAARDRPGRAAALVVGCSALALAETLALAWLARRTARMAAERAEEKELDVQVLERVAAALDAICRNTERGP
jgi:hypothetical protein